MVLRALSLSLSLTGVELTPAMQGGQLILELGVEGGGVGCVLQLPPSAPASPPGLSGFLRTMRAMTARRLASYDAQWARLTAPA